MGGRCFDGGVCASVVWYNVFEWVVALEDVLSDFLAEKTVVRDVSNWNLHFPRDVV